MKGGVALKDKFNLLFELSYNKMTMAAKMEHLIDIDSE